MNLTLVSMHIEVSARAVSLAAGMLAASLKRAMPQRVAVGLVDLYLDSELGEAAAAVLEQHPDAVGLSLYVWNREPMLALAAALKRQRPQLVIFAGGPEVTADAAGVAAHGAVDFVLPGEGEELVVEALRALLAGESPAAIGARLRPAPVANLEKLPSPYLTGILSPKRYAGLLWELSRGCPFACDFCFESRGNRGVRRFPLERLRAELALFADSGVRQLFVLDPTFNYDPHQAKDMLRIMAEVAPAIHYTIEVRAEFIDEEMAALFAGVDCALQIGLQSADPAVLANIHRDLDPDDFSERILLLHEAGVIYGFDLIYGLPGDTLDGFLGSLDYALGLRPNHLDIFPLAVLPGTRLAETAPGFGLHFQAEPPYRLLSSPTFGVEAMARAKAVARGCDLFYNRGRAVPWFDLLLDYLELSPAAFFLELVTRLPAAEPVGAELIAWQQQVLTEFFTAREETAALGPLLDVVAWFGWSAALHCGEVGQAQPAAAVPGRLYLNPDSCFVSFGRDPQALLEKLEMGVVDPATLAMLVPDEPAEVLLYLHGGEVALGVFAREECAWLKGLAASGGAPPEDADLAAFCEAALEEGVLWRA